MKISVLLAFVLGTIGNILTLNAQTSDFSFQLEPLTIPGFTGVQSAAVGITNGKIVVLGGRTDGLHRRQPFASFLPDGNNPLIHVIDPVSLQYWSAPLSSLPPSISDQLLATNLQFNQVGPWLYLIGGYGYNATLDDHITYDKLTAVRIDSLVSAIINGQTIAPWFLQTSNPQLALSGGQLGRYDGVFYMVGGHNFTGRYNPMNHPTFTQTYGNEVRRFTISNDGQNLSVNFLPAWSDPVNLHRRDYNMLPQVFPDGHFGFTAFSGVFQQFVDLPYLNSVNIDPSGYSVNNDFQHRLNQYHCAHFAAYDTEFNRMHSLFFGGISQFYFNDNGTMIQDDNVPFVRTIGRVTRLADGSMTETKIGDLPSYLGASAEFIWAPGAAMLNGEDILDLNAYDTQPALIGYIVGGIASEQANIFFSNDNLSTASNQLLAVFLVNGETSAIQVPPSIHQARAISLSPNPAKDNATLEFTLDAKTHVDLSIQAPDGRLILMDDWGELPPGLQKTQLQLDNFPNGMYMLTLTVGQEAIPLKLVIEH